MKALFDTNILIDHLAGQEEAHDELRQHYRPMISIITWMEVMAGIDERTDQQLIDQFFTRFEIININKNIAEISVSLRRKYKMKLPDAIIWASAKNRNATLITRNTKDFSKAEPDVYCPYQLGK
jgi:predicted nucleic acid-binding protein